MNNLKQRWRNYDLFYSSHGEDLIWGVICMIAIVILSPIWIPYLIVLFTLDGIGFLCYLAADRLFGIDKYKNNG